MSTTLGTEASTVVDGGTNWYNLVGETLSIFIVFDRRPVGSILMHRLKYLLAPCSIIVFALVSQVAFADESANLVRFAHDPTLWQHVIATAARSAVVVNNPCPSAQYTPAGDPLVSQPMTFNAAGAAISGLLHFPIREVGCGSTRILNVFVAPRPDGQVAVVPFLPGTTHADPLLQKNASQYAFIAATTLAGKDDACKVNYISDTEFVQRESATTGASTSSPWREIWTIVYCNKKITVPLLFKPDASGTQIVSGGPGGKVMDLNR